MSEKLVVVARLGIFGSEPYGFYDALADHLDADQHVPDEIHDEIFNDEDRGNRSKRKVVERAMIDQTVASLEEGKSVIFDAYVNKPSKREQLVEVATGLGALAVLIHPYAPMSVIRHRIADQHAANQLYTSNEEKGVGWYITLANQMRGYFDREDINPHLNRVPHLCVDGTQTVSTLIPQFDTYVEELKATS